MAADELFSSSISLREEFRLAEADYEATITLESMDESPLHQMEGDMQEPEIAV